MASVYTPGVSVTLASPPVVLNGVGTNVSGVVGTATDGPVNNPTAVTGATASALFGQPQNRKYDLMTVVQEAAVVGAATIWCQRVTDGTDTAATATVNAAVFTSLYTGSNNNSTVLTFASAGIANAITLTVSKAGAATEIYPNLSAANAAAFTTALTNAVNLGVGSGIARAQSQIVKVSGTFTGLPVLPSSITMTGGTDGATTINAAVLVGTDTTPKKGMYGLRNLGILNLVLADADDSTQWTTIDAFAQTEAMLAIQTLPAGSTPATAVAAKQAAGLNSNRSVLLHGDWISYTDANYGLRKISPQSFYLGMRASLLPFQSVLNKAMDGIATSERIAAASPYSGAETDQLFAAGIELISNPIPRGAAWGCLGGYNTTSTQVQNSDAWSATTNYLVQTLKTGMGLYVGEPINIDTMRAVRSTLNSFLGNMTTNGWLALNADGTTPYLVVCDSTNNLQTQNALGFLFANVNVTYQGIVRFFNITLNGSAVVVTESQVPVSGN